MSRFLKSLAALAVGVLTLVPARADAVTLQEIIELTRAGLGDEVLLALIEINQRVYPVDPETLRSLKKAGVSEKVIVAVVRSGRTVPADVVPPLAVVAPPPAPQPQVVVIERETPVITEVPVAVPVYVAVESWRHDRRHGRHDDNDDRDRGDDKPAKPAEPVYWGWGGKLRPDAWQPASPPPVRRDGSKR